MLAATLFECLTGKDCKHQILKRLRNASTLYYPEKVLRHFEGFSNVNYSTSQSKRRLLFYTLFLAYICAGIVSILPGPTLPILAQHTGVALAVAGWAFTSGATGFMVGVAIAGVMIGRIGPKYVLMSGLAIMTCTGIVTPWTHLFPVLLAAQFVAGIGFGFLDVSINIIVTLSFEDTLGETLNNLHSSYGI